MDRDSPCTPDIASVGATSTSGCWAVVPHLSGVRFLRGVLSDHDRSRRMGGRPCIRGLRVTVGMILGQLAAGRTVEDVLEDYPYLERDDVLFRAPFPGAVPGGRW